MNSYQQQLDKFLVTVTITTKEARIINRALEHFLDDHSPDFSGDDRKTITRVVREFENEMDECIEIVRRVPPLPR